MSGFVIGYVNYSIHLLWPLILIYDIVVIVSGWYGGAVRSGECEAIRLFLPSRNKVYTRDDLIRHWQWSTPSPYEATASNQTVIVE